MPAETSTTPTKNGGKMGIRVGFYASFLLHYERKPGIIGECSCVRNTINRSGHIVISCNVSIKLSPTILSLRVMRIQVPPWAASIMKVPLANDGVRGGDFWCDREGGGRPARA